MEQIVQLAIGESDDDDENPGRKEIGFDSVD